jgi:hypothetical protein
LAPPSWTRRHAATFSSRDRDELMVSAAIPLSRSAATWSFISATSGETTIATPSRISAGTW